MGSNTPSGDRDWDMDIWGATIQPTTAVKYETGKREKGSS